MNCSITSSESENTTSHSDKPRKPIRGKSTTIGELEEDLFLSPVIRHVCQGNQDSKEA